MEPYLWTIQETLAALSAKQISRVELAQLYLDRIGKYNHSLKAFLTVADDVLDKARRLDDAAANGKPIGPLAGILIAVKDLYDTEGLRTTYGGRHYKDFIPSSSATAVQRLEAAGAIVIGKTNLHEYAYGTTTENPHYGSACNPWNRTKIAGGSSGGSAVAVAAGLCHAALGTDTGGSIRIPAALCGHVGFKPSFGRVSTTGVFPLAPTLDHAGPMTRTVGDAQQLMEVLSGFDPADPYSSQLPVPSFLKPARPGKLRLGIPGSFFFERCHTSVLQVVQSALQSLQDQGIEFDTVDIPLIQDVPGVQSVVIGSEAHAIHRERLQTQAELYGDDVRNRLFGAAEIAGSEYFASIAFRRQFRERLADVFAQVDAVLTPTTPLTATDLGQWKTHVKAHEVNIRGHLTRCTNPWNLSGLPAVSLPCGLSSDGLPVGLQVVGPMNGDVKVLQVAKALEDVLGVGPIAPDYR